MNCFYLLLKPAAMVEGGYPGRPAPWAKGGLKAGLLWSSLGYVPSGTSFGWLANTSNDLAWWVVGAAPPSLPAAGDFLF